jgi:TatD DNase family protein
VIVDSHCHLNYGGLAEHLDDVVNRAHEADVGIMLAINTKIHEFDEVLQIANSYDGIYASVGVHPHEAASEPDVALATLLERAKHDKVIGIGETGLDYYYDKSPREQQKANFRTHIDAARDSGLPVIVHTRDAEDDTFEILAYGMAKGPYSGVIHCFTASRSFAEKALELGLYISFSGILTFKNAADIQEIAKSVPLDRVLVETDAPFLAPVPNRGKTCEPAFTADTAAFLARLRGMELDEIANITTDNFFRLFSKAKRPI